MSASCRYDNGFHMRAQFLRPVHTSLQPASKWLQPKALHVALIPKAALQPATCLKSCFNHKICMWLEFRGSSCFEPSIRHIIIRSSDAIGTYECIPRMGSKRNLSLFILVPENTWQDLHYVALHVIQRTVPSIKLLYATHHSRFQAASAA